MFDLLLYSALSHTPPMRVSATHAICYMKHALLAAIGSSIGHSNENDVQS